MLPFGSGGLTATDAARRPAGDTGEKRLRMETNTPLSDRNMS